MLIILLNPKLLPLNLICLHPPVLLPLLLFLPPNHLAHHMYQIEGEKDPLQRNHKVPSQRLKKFNMTAAPTVLFQPHCSRRFKANLHHPSSSNWAENWHPHSHHTTHTQQMVGSQSWCHSYSSRRGSHSPHPHTRRTTSVFHRSSPRPSHAPQRPQRSSTRSHRQPCPAPASAPQPHTHTPTHR